MNGRAIAGKTSAIYNNISYCILINLRLINFSLWLILVQITVFLIKITLTLLPFTVKMKKRSKGPAVFVVVIFLFLTIVIYTSQSNRRTMRIKIPQIDTRHSFVSSTSEVKANNTEPRLNVILLTLMSSGSTVVGNMFNLHPDVFYIYEPLHALRRKVYGGEWLILNKSRSDAFKKDFSTLLRDLFTCSFQEKRTIELVFPTWERTFNSWYKKSTPLTKESLSKACNERKITVTKVMQTRIPREAGIREVERVCRSDPRKFDCLIVHLVRDPRAVLSSLMSRGFFLKSSIRKMFAQKPLPAEAISVVKQNAQMICSLITGNLDNVNSEWSNWFKSRYILVRYEDAISNMSRAVNDMYKSLGLDMAEPISKWLKGVPPPGQSTSRTKATVLSNTDAATIDKWRSRQSSSLVSLLEETCRPLMEAMGYIFVNGSETLQRNNSKPLKTPNIPFLRNFHSTKP